MKYKTRDITPESMICGVGPCPAIYESVTGGESVYLVVGKVVNPSEAGLKKKVGDGEALIEVSRSLINDRKNYSRE